MIGFVVDKSQTLVVVVLAFVEEVEVMTLDSCWRVELAYAIQYFVVSKWSFYFPNV